MDVVFALFSTAHYGYHESTIRSLRDRGHRVRVLFAKEGGVSPFERVRERLPGDGVEVGWLTARGDRWRRVLSSARALRSYSSYLRHPEQSDYYTTRWPRRLGSPLEGVVALPLARRVLATRAAFALLGAVERLAPADRAIVGELE